MKLFAYDEKHESVNQYVDLGELTNDQIKLVDKIINSLEALGFSDRYRRLVLAESYEIKFENNPPDWWDLGEIIFNRT